MIDSEAGHELAALTGRRCHGRVVGNPICRTCHLVLGHVRDGVLRPLARVESVDEWGVARVPRYAGASPRPGRGKRYGPPGRRAFGGTTDRWPPGGRQRRLR